MSISKICAVILATALVSSTLAQTNYYVIPFSPTSTDALPWTNWATAHTNLIEVARRARDNDVIYVTNQAVYYLTNQVTLTFGVKLRSWSPDGSLDPETTVLNGNYPDTLNRCLYISNYHASVSGFTVTNGYAYSADVDNGGGGVVIRRGGHLTNCIIAGNRYYGMNDGSVAGGGGIWIRSASGSVWSCTIRYNTSYCSGGGIKATYQSPLVVSECIISDNVCSNIGGGISLYSALEFEVARCRIESNTANKGGGCSLVNYGLLDRCVVLGNQAVGSAPVGGGVHLMGDNPCVRNCVIYENTSRNGGGAYFIGGQIQNSIIYNNVATSSYGGGVSVQVAASGYLENSIIWANRVDSGGSSNYWLQTGSSVLWLTNSCAPQSITYTNAFFTNCIFSDPLLMAMVANNVRLQAGSPCINAGINRDWMAGALDLDGRQRLDRFSRKVDIGCYEYIPQGMLFMSK